MHILFDGTVKAAHEPDRADLRLLLALEVGKHGLGTAPEANTAIAVSGERIGSPLARHLLRPSERL